MRRNSRIAVSAAMTTGLLGVAAVAVASVPHLTAGSSDGGSDSSFASGSPASERGAIEGALARMDQRAGSLEDQLAAARAALATASESEPAASATHAPSAVAVSHPVAQAKATHHASKAAHTTHATHEGHKAKAAPASTPTPTPTHTTTGARGSTGGGDDGGGDDGGGSDDDGGDGGSDG